MTEAKLWAVIPAAGSGQRFGASTPKQFLRLAGKPVIQHAIDALLALPDLQRLVVATAADDPHWNQLPAAGDARITAITGGATRAASVLAGLQHLQNLAAADDWVLVHDAARPLITAGQIEQLRAALAGHAVGGVLAVPVADTVKRCNRDGAIEQTVDRSTLWAAQTPQLFRYQLLCDSLTAALQAGVEVTDEAQAVELAGHTAQVVEGSPDNFKITLPAQLELAEYLMARRSA